MRASKGRFALATLSSIVTCLLLGLSATSTGLPTAIISKISEAFGFGAIVSGTPNMVAGLLTITAVMAIYKFATNAITHWEAPIRVSETELAERYLDNSLYALSVEQLRLFVKKQVDPIASEFASNWQANFSDPPEPVEAKDLLRDLLVASFREIQIFENGWRDDGSLWVGEVLGLQLHQSQELLALVFDELPTPAKLLDRIKGVRSRIERIEDFRVFAIYFSENDTKDASGVEEVDGLNIEILSSRKMIMMGLDLHGYARELLKNFRNTKVGDTNATLENSYVELLVDRPDSGWGAVPLTSKLRTWLKDDNNAHMVITGEYGQGKSTALLKYCCDWAERFLNDGSIAEKIPLLIELRGKSPAETDPLGFLSTWCSRYRLLPQQVLNLIKSGEAIVIFEGFDELKNAGRAFDRHQHFNALWRFAYPGSKLIFTGRPNFF